MKIALLSLKRNGPALDEIFVSFIVNWAFNNNKLPQLQISFDYLDRFFEEPKESFCGIDYFLISGWGHNFDSEADYQKILKLQEKSSVFSEIYLILNRSLDWYKWQKAGIKIISNNSPLIWLDKTFKNL